MMSPPLDCPFGVGNIGDPGCVFVAVLGTKMEALGSKLDDLRLEFRERHTIEARAVESLSERVSSLEASRSEMKGMVSTIRILFGTSVLAAALSLWELVTSLRG